MTTEPMTAEEALARTLRKVAPGKMWPVRGIREVENRDFAAAILAALTDLGYSLVLSEPVR